MAAVTLFAMVALYSASPQACQFHTYLPELTIVDRMLASDHIVLARPDPENPFRFVAVEAVEGKIEGVDIPQLVDSVARRRLASNPSDTVLFARNSYGSWAHLAYIDRVYRGVIDRVVARLPDWRHGNDQGRYEMFADLHDHEHRAIRTLALSELDRAPYGILRTLNIRPSAEAIVSDMGDIKEIGLLPIRVLLLGLSGDTAVRDMLRRNVLSAATSGASSFAGAYATALIELEGPEAAAWIAENLLADPRLSPRTKEILIEALAIQSRSGAPDTRAATAKAVHTAILSAPDLAAPVARQFGSRQDWTQRDTLANLLRDRRLANAADLIAVSQYVARADAAGDTHQ